MGVADAPELGVVLGGGIGSDGAPLPSTRARAHRAAQLARERPELILICSGDRQLEAAAGTPSEAALMRDLISGWGVDTERVVLEEESRDTLGNAVLTAAPHLHGIRAPPPLTEPIAPGGSPCPTPSSWPSTPTAPMRSSTERRASSTAPCRPNGCRHARSSPSSRSTRSSVSATSIRPAGGRRRVGRS